MPKKSKSKFYVWNSGAQRIKVVLRLVVWTNLIKVKGKRYHRSGNETDNVKHGQN